jgi:hypothetical protein
LQVNILLLLLLLLWVFIVGGESVRFFVAFFLNDAATLTEASINWIGCDSNAKFELSSSGLGSTAENQENLPGSLVCR